MEVGSHFNIHPQKTKISEIFENSEVSCKKNKTLKQKRMTMIFLCHITHFPNHFSFCPPSVDGNKTSPLDLLGEVSRFDDETLGSRYVRLSDVVGKMKISHKTSQLTIYPPVILTWLAGK